MPFNINSIYFPEHHYIAVFIKGIVDTSLAKDVIAYAISEMKTHDCNKVYFDVSETLSLATTADNYQLANLIPELIKSQNIKWAVYYKNDPQMYEYINSIIKTLGVEGLKLFEDKTIAKEWILSD